MAANPKKGEILVVKVPPFFDREYFYEVLGAGGKIIRATLYHSPKVKKHWTLEEYALLVEHGLIRPAGKEDLQRLAQSGNEAQTSPEQDENSDKDPPDQFK